MISDDARYRILKILDDNPDISQRQLAEELGISLGKVNYCLQSLIEKGIIKAGNFSKNPNKKNYLYMLTPEGVLHKAAITAQFLKRKMAEYEALKLEIEDLKQEMGLPGHGDVSAAAIQNTTSPHGSLD